ncbi:hypothetical protein, partial [Acinetobacter sp.]|uniref:hypothetical protein n=1 Tax=Acinetobacter sp. TaxID=472 RepID=UPI003750ADAA
MSDGEFDFVVIGLFVALAFLFSFLRDAIMKILSIVLGSVDVECPKCFSRFHHQYLPFHMSKC